ncbi:metabolite traffic protein EboE [Granulosicoccus sp. 3-233]|uniref:metabolite traffic protein EboE n=1 Tax=Granulosicoccus sp. 3-233 TaxID=3417969 RepID=UPI003D3332AE
MKLVHASGSLSHLGYCSNIHAGESWQAVRENLQRYIPGIRDALVPGEAFGIGLRLSAAAVDDLDRTDALHEFRQFLDQNNLYVFTINGFPYGPFHGTRVKEDVYLPDWMDEERLRYTNQLANVLARILPEACNGSISTVPGAFKARVISLDDVRQMADNLVRHAAHLARLHEDTGRFMSLALEPEPCCYLETIDESVHFFSEQLFGETSAALMANLLSTSKQTARDLLQKHLTLCLDLCHAAVEFEDPAACLTKLESANITVGKLQISSGLRLKDVNADTVGRLEPYIDNVYLHQVVEYHDGTLNRFTDLPEAIEQLGDSQESREWRVHFHVPIFLEELADFSSTQTFVEAVLNRHKLKPVSEHLEVETYTWDVLPPELRTESVDQAIIREMRWVMEALS